MTARVPFLGRTDTPVALCRLDLVWAGLHTAVGLGIRLKGNSPKDLAMGAACPRRGGLTWWPTPCHLLFRPSSSARWERQLTLVRSVCSADSPTGSPWGGKALIEEPRLPSRYLEHRWDDDPRSLSAASAPFRTDMLTGLAGPLRLFPRHLSHASRARPSRVSHAGHRWRPQSSQDHSRRCPGTRSASEGWG